ncbi:hypothetical protein GJA_3054 [Janthinobacterium agaricidamnosum NBRC 102515 = DSM 9628]|uniref:Uncharacterized protein n=1 Tax=Janthinobacterium agaricidamnosum NBRC 102515 = DSM 9628 TaxID=1349767 RepID=W0V7U3_9BURK|nr:hypothetical protein GJA_3054 [Janthinobacterium agaricidamnosum NBRC 102515 = DSM 9628]
MMKIFSVTMFYGGQNKIKKSTIKVSGENTVNFLFLDLKVNISH